MRYASMKRYISFALLTFSMSFSALGKELPCDELESISTPRPEYPTYEQAQDILPGTSYLHVFIEGFVKVQFTVLKSGLVTDVMIIESESQPTRTIKKSVDGFLEMNAIPTVSKWQFKPVSTACIQEHIFRYELSQDA